jgi:general secretion pathway protein D
LVEFLDTQYFSTNTVDLVPIRFNQATEVAEDLGKIFAPGDQAAGVRIVAIERLNSILVITRSAEVFQEVNKWIVKLDSPSATSNMKTSVYQVENNTAVQIAQILAELYQDGFGLPSTQTGDTGERTGSQSSGLDQTNRVPTREPGFVSGSQFDQRGYGQSGFGGSAFGGASGGAMGMRQLGPALSSSSQSQIRGIVAGNVKIVVNEFNNSLIIQGTEADIQFILDTVRQLDTLPRQVVIEAQIYSVELRDELSFGVAAFLQESGAGDIGDGTTGSVGPATTAQVGTDPAGQLTVITRAVIGAERELQAILNALRAKTNVEIVEAPRVLAMDGTPASINIGAEVPVTSASFGNPLQSGTTSFVNSIQFRPTGTTLMIVPRISASGIVTMDLVLEISSATGPALTPTINRNYIQSSFIVGDGQTVGIAGLISDSYNLSRNRVPLLGDIPILGALFGQTSRDERRAELIIFITPRVIRNLPTATEMTLDFKRALRDSYEFINTQQEKEAALVEERRQKELEEVEP